MRRNRQSHEWYEDGDDLRRGEAELAWVENMRSYIRWDGLVDETSDPVLFRFALENDR